MKIKVIGKAHLEGTSKKTGKPYNLNQIHFNAPARGVEGEAAQTIMVDAVQYPIGAIFVGSTYNVEFDRFGYVVNLDLMPSNK